MNRASGWLLLSLVVCSVGLARGQLQDVEAVLLLESPNDRSSAWVDDISRNAKNLTYLVASEVFDSESNMTQQLLDELAFNSTAVLPPVIGLGETARHAMLLAYDAWPVAVAVAPDLRALDFPENATKMGQGEPILLIISDIDRSGDNITDLEEVLDGAGIRWQTVRYGGTGPRFFNSSSESFRPEAWSRAVEEMGAFLTAATSDEGFAGTEDPGLAVPEGVVADIPFNYEDGGEELEGYLAYPAGAEERVGDLPFVVILPDWDHVNEYEIKRANMIAAMGYVALAANIYGLPVNTTVESFGDRISNSTYWRSENPDLYVQRIRAAVAAAAALPYTNEALGGLTGYCFGGSGVVFDVLNSSQLKVDVSFHGGLSSKPDVLTTPPMVPYLSYQSGGSDESPEDMAWLQSVLVEMGGEWDITRFSEVGHGFTEWDSERYHARADGMSWAAMKRLFEEHMPLPSGGGGSGGDDSGSATLRGALTTAVLAVLALTWIHA
mmetsp:Transcript_10088/g.24058  ORF Transcript_10088/g.24058 Transcript_10088/m.24058 type:complete len:495 (+) Transcript_10088:140-1624(+)